MRSLPFPVTMRRRDLGDAVNPIQAGASTALKKLCGAPCGLATSGDDRMVRTWAADGTLGWYQQETELYMHRWR
ncbi:MAG TPA: hypothetical protein VN969_23795 [Streptosporangiaceae bacterium]|nr:hypothetical protein [Streptosporangiaceae bacterium]